MLPLITEYSGALVDAIYRTCPKYQVVTRPDRTPYFVAGAFGCVFKAINPTNNRLLAIKCFTKHVDNKQQRLEAVATYLNQQKSPYTLHYQYLPNELWVGNAEREDYYPILLMEWVEGETLGQAVQKAAQQGDKARLQQLADNFTDLALWLLAQPIAHTDLKHDNILVKPNNSLVLIDYDGMFVPALANYPAENKGVEEYQHPQRQLSDFNQHLDDFSIALIAAALYGLAQQPTLYNQYNQYGSPDNLLFKAEDFKQPKNSPLWKALQALHHPIITPLLDQLLTALQTNSLQLPRLSTTLQPLPNTIQATEALIAQKKQELLRLEQHLTHLQNAPTLKPPTPTPTLNSRLQQVLETIAQRYHTPTPTPTLKPLPQPIQQLINNLVLVEGGTFMMGSPNTEADRSDDEYQHRVTLSSFYMGKYQVTQAQWQAVMGNNPSHFKGDNLPVESVSWDNIQVFLEKLNTLYSPPLGGQGGGFFRLPTEAEWEYAARGGNKSQGYTYAGSNNLNEVAWYCDNSNSKTHPVGQKKPNELGIYDMSGNVWEWCQDWYNGDYYKNSPANNPTGPTSGTYRVLRGGSWNNYLAVYCRVAHRYYGTPSYRGFYYGFRLVCFP